MNWRTPSLILQLKWLYQLMVRVQIVKSTKVLPQQSKAVSMKLDGCRGSNGLWVLEPDLDLEKAGLHVYGAIPFGSCTG